MASSGGEAEGRVTVWNTLEHMRRKDMWVGSLARVADPDLRGLIFKEDGWKVLLLVLAHSPALLTIIDEILVNATDQVQRVLKNPKRQRVTRIDVAFSQQGHVTVENDGPGIPIEPTAVPPDFQRGGHPTLWTPEVCFSVPLAGSELERDPTSVKGGVNGAGAKGMCVNSTWVRVTTRAVPHGMGGLHEYVQVFQNRLLRNRDDVSEPTLTPCPDRTGPLTRVEFLPAYGEMGYAYASDASGATVLDPAEHAELTAWFRWRLCIIAAYVGRYGVAVTFNGEALPANSTEAIAHLILGRRPPPAAEEKREEDESDGEASAPSDGVIVRTFALKAKAEAAPKQTRSKNAALVMQNKAAGAYHNHPWEVTVAVGPGVGRWYVSSVSGVETLDGTQKKFLERLVVGYVTAEIQKTAKDKDRKIRDADILRDVGIVSVCALPGANWDEQRKNKLSIPGKDPFQAFVPARPPAKLKEAVQASADAFLLSTGALKTTKLRNIPKYRKPNGPKRPGRRIILDEGDSADRTAQRIRSLLAGGLDLFATFCLGGVVMNGVEQSRKVVGPDGKTKYIPTQKLIKNERLNALRQVLGLEFGQTYDTDEKVAALPYDGGIVLFVDEDTDGKGKICPLVVAFIGWFWPELLLRPGWICRLQTPVVRVYPRGTKRSLTSARSALVFYYEWDYEKWCAANPEEAEAARKEGRVKYFKGLAGHDPQTEVPVIAEGFAQNLIGFDPRGETVEGVRRHLQLFYGKNGEDNLARKALIRAPASRFEAEELRAARESAALVFGTSAPAPAKPARGRKKKKILAGLAASKPSQIFPLRRILDVDAGLYKRADVEQKMPNVVDGLKVTSRKVVDTVLPEAHSASKPVERKIYQLGGRVAEKKNFHHGDASLYQTIIGLAQTFPGAKEVPPLISTGEVGSRSGSVPKPKTNPKAKRPPCGPGTDAGSPRYVGALVNKPLMQALYSREDEPFLVPVIEDGEAVQPEYTLPNLPVAILETSVTLSEGWSWRCYARDLGSVCGLLAKGLTAEHAPLFQEVADRVYSVASSQLYRPGVLDEITAPIQALAPLTHSTRGWGGSVCLAGGPAAGGAGSDAAAPSAAVDPAGARALRDAPESARVPHPESKEISFGSLYLLDGEGGYWDGVTGDPAFVRIVELPKWVGIEKFLYDLSLPADAKELTEGGKKSQKRLHELVVDGTRAENVAGSQDAVLIQAPLRPGAMAAAARIFPQRGPHALIPPIYRALGLYSWVTPSLSFLGPTRKVLELGQNYHAAFLIWYKVRREAYTQRVTRQAEIAALQVLRMEQTIAFCKANPDLRGATDEVAEKNLHDGGYIPLDTALLNKLEDGMLATELPTERIRATVMDPSPSLGGTGRGSYNYLRSLKGTSFVDTAIERREAELAKARERMEACGRDLKDPVFPGASAWMREAGGAAHALQAGWANNWCS